MTAAFTRPPISGLTFRLFDRPVHPEFFETLILFRLALLDARFVVHITRTGHVLEWHRGSTNITEVIATQEQELPERSRLQHPFLNARRGRCEVNGVLYQVGIQSESLPPQLFVEVHDDLMRDSKKPGVLFYSRPHSQGGLPPLGLVNIQPLATGWNISTFHTYPDDCAIIKTQSLIEPQM